MCLAMHASCRGSSNSWIIRYDDRTFGSLSEVTRVITGLCCVLETLGIRVIQVPLGHNKLETPALYTKVPIWTICAVTGPLDR